MAFFLYIEGIEQETKRKHASFDLEIQKLIDELDEILEPYGSEEVEDAVEVNNHQFRMVDLFSGDPDF
jgi:hypothetical protein